MTASGILKLGSIDLSFLSKSVHKKINFVVIRNSFKGNDQERIRRKKSTPLHFSFSTSTSFFHTSHFLIY